MRLCRLAQFLVALLASALPLCAQANDSGELLGALERWTRAFLAGKVDVTDPQPIGPAAPPRLPPRLSAFNAQRLTELQALEVLLRAVSELGSTAAAERLLRVAAIGHDDKTAKLSGAVIVRGAAEEAIDQCASPSVHGYLQDLVRRPSKNAEDGAVRIAAVRALGGSGEAVFWPILTGLLREPEAPLRSAAARALGDLGNARSIADMAQALRDEKDAPVVQSIAVSLRDLLEIADRDSQLDPLLHRDAIRAVASALGRTDDWRVNADLVRFLERHRSVDAVPALIETLARAQAASKVAGDAAAGARTLQAEAHRALKAMTGAVLGAEHVDAWRELWRSGKDTLKIVPRRREALSDKATVAGGFFGIPVLGRRVVFIIDRSGSMVSPAPQPDDASAADAGMSTRLDIARRECWNAVKEMGPDTYFNLVVFSAKAQVWKPDLVPATTANKGALRNYLQRMSPDGSTNLWEALSLATKLRTMASKSDDREPVDEIFVLSDGYPSSGEITHAPTIVARISEQNRHTNIRINTVFIGAQASDLDRLAQPGGQQLMQELAAQNKGVCVVR